MLKSVSETLQHRGISALASAIYGIFKIHFFSRLLGRRFVTHKVYGYRLLLDTKDRGISRTLLLFGKREVEHRIMLQEIVKEGSRIFDIGANIGYYAIMEAQLVGSEGEIIAIEPSPSNVELLKKNVALNDQHNIRVVSAAVSDTDGAKTFFLSDKSNLGTFHNVGSGVEHLNGQTIDVNTLSLNSLAGQYGAPDLIRMDVEGHEVSVLRGLIDLLGIIDRKPTIIFETHLSRYNEDNDMHSTLLELFRLGYKVTLAGSSWEAGTKIVEGLGYSSLESVKSDGYLRKIFRNIKSEHAINLICETGGLRTVVLQAD